MTRYKKTWLKKYKYIPKSAYGFPTCMYIISLEAWRRDLKVTFNMRRSRSLMTGLSFTVTNGKKTYRFNGSRGSKTKREAIEICKNKSLTLEYLRKANIPVPEGKDFSPDTLEEKLINYANSLGYPLVLKPGTGGGGGGFGVVTNIQTEQEMKRCIRRLKRRAPRSRILIERFFEGEDFRINVFQGKVIGAFHRRAQSVVGNGRDTIAQLIQAKNEERQASPFLAKSNIKLDKNMKTYLEEQGLSIDFIPENTERIYVRRNGEYFGQRDAINVTKTLPKKMLHIAERAVQAIPGLSIGGVDMLINLKENTCVINEINSLPQISNHVFPLEGEAIDIPKIIMDEYFPETKGKESINEDYYYNFTPILENFRTGNTLNITLRPIPKRKQLKTFLKVKGENFTERYFERMKRLAARYSINGYVKQLDEHTLEYKISGGKNRLNAYKRYILNSPIKATKIEFVNEQDYDGPIMVGFFTDKKDY